MKKSNIILIEGETYFTKFDNHVVKLKLEKIHKERINGNNVQVSVRSFPKKRNKTDFDSWILWSNEIYQTRKEAEKVKN